MSSLSVVIPAYNEEEIIGPCLDALLAQEESVHEIIVVDNNSSDRTREICREYQGRYSNVILVDEPAQGVVFARNAGCDTATGDLIARIDADTLVDSGWASAIGKFFKENKVYSAVTGVIYLYDSPWSAPYRKWLDFATSRRIATRWVMAAPGGNFAMRASAWASVRDKVSDRTDMHEDIDLSLCLHDDGQYIAQITDMKVAVSGRRLATNPVQYRHYVFAAHRAWKHHGLMPSFVPRAMFLDWLFHTLRWPVSRAFASKDSRILPVSAGPRLEIRREASVAS